jgi:aspartate beta-hydroxylase
MKATKIIGLLIAGSFQTNAFLIEPQPSSSLGRSSPILEMVSSTPSTTAPATHPLAPHTFAGMVEQGLTDKFGDDAHRVIESWRLLEMGYEHREFVGPQQDPPRLDAKASQCHQLAPSFVPGLAAREFYDTNQFPWCQKLASRYKEIREEFDAVTADMAKLKQEGNNIWAGALTEGAGSYGVGWKTLVLMDRGVWDAVNVNLFPMTAKAVKDSGAPVVEVFFASMDAKSDIKLHSDFTNFVVTSHLALDIPQSGENKCRLTIGDTTRQWINGEVMVFDTSIMHAAVNEADKTRYILMLRLWHPDLTDVERHALQFIYDCLMLPDLVSPDPLGRMKAEMELQGLKTFPLVPGRGSGGGFGAAAEGFGTGAKKKASKRK